MASRTCKISKNDDVLHQEENPGDNKQQLDKQQLEPASTSPNLNLMISDFLKKNESSLRILVPIVVCFLIGLAMYFIGRNRGKRAVPQHSSFHNHSSRVRTM